MRFWKYIRVGLLLLSVILTFNSQSAYAAEEEDTLILEVTDQGIGMTKEQIAHIKEAFYRVDKSRSRAAGGAGLGLSICERIVQLHQGKLEFISLPGEGTTARVFLPCGMENRESL